MIILTTNISYTLYYNLHKDRLWYLEGKLYASKDYYERKSLEILIDKMKELYIAEHVVENVNIPIKFYTWLNKDKYDVQEGLEILKSSDGI